VILSIYLIARRWCASPIQSTIACFQSEFKIADSDSFKRIGGYRLMKGMNNQGIRWTFSSLTVAELRVGLPVLRSFSDMNYLLDG
jgi:hypothetical protein